MATEEIEIGKKEIGYKGLFSLNALYELIYRWLVSKKFIKKPEKDFNERYIVIEDTPEGRNISINLEFYSRDWLFKRILGINIECLKLEKREVIKDNLKFKVEKGEIKIKLKAKLEFDPEEKFKKNFFTRQYYKYIWKPINGKVIKNARDDYIGDFEKLYGLIQEFFGIKEEKPGETWIVKKGYGIE